MNLDKGVYSIEYYSAIKCNELYKTAILNDPENAVEFSSDLWICPDVESITVMNNPP